MRVAVIDVGSNTARLLVASVHADGSVVPVAEERSYLRLGAEIERTGNARREEDRAAAETCGAFARRAAELDAVRSTVIVTAPGRQGASAAALTAALGEATGLPVRVLTADGEGRLAYDGAVARATGELPEVVAVVDVGGGSTEIVVGHPVARRRLDPVGRHRLAPPHPGAPARRSADRRAGCRCDRRGGPARSPACAPRFPTSRWPWEAAPARSRRSSAAASAQTTSTRP